ncbi:MAG: HrpJ domain-containing protein [Pararobbsia sp.]
MTTINLPSLRNGVRVAATFAPHRSARSDVGTDTSNTSLAELAWVMPDEAPAVLPLAMRYRARYGAGFDRERILAENADVLLDDAERATVREPTNAGEALLALTQERFTDPSDALMALRELRQRAGLAEYAAAFELAERQLALLVPRRTLLSGANAALVARAHADALAAHDGAGRAALRAGEFRMLYRHFVDGNLSALDTYADWIAKYDTVCRVVLVDFVRDALVADMDAADPSCTQIEFMPLADALRALLCLRRADQAFAECLRAAAQHAGWPVGVHEADLDAPFARMLVDGLRGASRGCDLVEWLISAGCDTQSARPRAIMVQALIAGFRMMPGDLYEPAANRDDLIEGLQAELTALAIGERVHDQRVLLGAQP